MGDGATFGRSSAGLVADRERDPHAPHVDASRKSAGQFLVSAGLRPIKTAVKAILRAAVYSRLKTLPLSEPTALWWANQFKQWPAIFDDAKTRRLVRLDHDVLMEVGIVDVIERNLRVHGVWDHPVKTALESLLRPGDEFLDLGANIGYFTLMASRLVGDTGRVVAVEPSIRALRKLTHHIWLNKCTNVMLISCAAGSEWSSGRIGWATESNIGGSAVVATAADAYTRTEPIWVAPIDDVLRGIELTPTVIKIDLEGYELAALQGAERLLKQRPWIVCEVTERLLAKFGASVFQLVQFLSEHGYCPCELAGVPHSLRRIPIAELSDPQSQCDVVFVPSERMDLAQHASR